MLRALGLRILACDGPVDADQHDVMRARVQSARFVLQTVAPNVGEAPIVDTTELALALAQRVPTGSPTTPDAEVFHHEMTSVIDDWYALLRRRIDPTC